MTMPDPDELDPSGELSAQIAAQQREYGTYVANQPIPAGNVLAYNVGHQVPISNVVRHGYFLAGLVDLVEGAEHDPEVAARQVPHAPEPASPSAEPVPGLTVDRAEPGGAPPIDEEERI